MSKNIPLSELTPALDLDSRIAEAGFAKRKQFWWVNTFKTRFSYELGGSGIILIFAMGDFRKVGKWGAPICTPPKEVVSPKSMICLVWAKLLEVVGRCLPVSGWCRKVFVFCKVFFGLLTLCWTKT